MQKREHAALSVEEMTVKQLDDVRHSLRLSKKQVCIRAGINQSTYQRWLKWARGDLDGCKPHPRSIRALRDVLSAEFGRDGTITQFTDAKDLSEACWPDQARDSRRGGEAGNSGRALPLAGKPDRAA
jgi:uncharacterized protein YigA (DUF484 family)